jgi:hypothetical protein
MRDLPFVEKQDFLHHLATALASKEDAGVWQRACCQHASINFLIHLRRRFETGADENVIYDVYHTECLEYLEMFSAIVGNDDDTYTMFVSWMATYYKDRLIKPCITVLAETVREKRRNKAAAVIRRALWRCVQRRRQLELLDELYRPGGIGAKRAQQRFEHIVRTF